MSKLVRENINDYLPAPSEEEIEKRLENANLEPQEILDKLAEIGWLKKIKDFFKEHRKSTASFEFPLFVSTHEGHKDVVFIL